MAPIKKEYLFFYEQMRIVFCLNDISLVGGIERVTIVKANALAAMEGNEVWIIKALQRLDNLKIDENGLEL